jgi:serine/threonine-protein kinase
MGLARLEYVDGGEQEETAAGVTLGTFDYISPEQARDPRASDMRSDIYSLGCTLFFMLTGRAPFSDVPVLQKLLQHQTEAPPDVRELRPEVSDTLATLLERMLAKRPEDRFADPTELAAALVGCIEQLGITPPQVALPAYWTDWVPRLTWWRRHAPWLVPVALLLLSVLALGIKWNRDAAGPALPEWQVPGSTSTTSTEDGAPNSSAL